MGQALHGCGQLQRVCDARVGVVEVLVRAAYMKCFVAFYLLGK